MPTKDDVIEALKTVEDPELFIDIWFLGLIYNIGIDGTEVDIDMTFTSPMCPAGPQLVNEVQEKVGQVEGIENVKVNVVFDPPWEPNDEVKALMGFI